MFTKTAKKLWVFISSAVASVCLAVGAIAMPPANVAKAAIAGDLSEEVTLNKVELEACTVTVSGSAQNSTKTKDGVSAQFLEFDMGESGNTWFMTEWTGKNAPNYAVRAVKGLSTWDGIYQEWISAPIVDKGGTYTEQGMMITNSQGFGAASMGIYRASSGMNTGYGRKEIQATDSESKRTLGMRYYNPGVTYVQIVGYEINATTASSADISVYLFKADGETLSLVSSTTVTATHSANVLAGKKAVIYGNIQCMEVDGMDSTALSAANNPDSVTFKYATPANSLEKLLKNVNDKYEYKSQIIEELKLANVEYEEKDTTKLVNSATWHRVDAIEGQSSNSFAYAAYDGFGGETWFMTQFTGANAPNFAVRAEKAYSPWNEESASKSDVKAGVLIAASSELAWADKGVFNGTNTNYSSTAEGAVGDKRGSFGSYGLYQYNNNKNKEYIQIIGYVPTSNSAATFYEYVYEVANGAITEVSNVNKSINGLKGAGSTAVIYPNIGVTPKGTAQGPESITFTYQAPANSLDNLIKGLSYKYAYKDDLATALEKSATSYTVTYEDMEGNVLVSETASLVKLPGSTLTDFVGWYNKADSKLYKAGEIVALTANTTFVEVAAGISLADGAAVRLKNDIVGNGGLRFEVVFSKAAYDLLGNVTLKGAVIPTDLLEGELTLGNSTAGFVNLNKMVEKDGAYHAYITLTDIKLENFQREFSARAFFIVTYADGSNGTVATAYDVEKNSRSIYEVAVKAYNSGKYGENAVLKYYLDNTVNVAIEVNEGVATVTTAHAYDGLAESFARGYAVSNVVVADGTVTFTVTLSGLTLTEEFAVTVWTAENTFETKIVTFENGVATVNFPVAL